MIAEQETVTESRHLGIKIAALKKEYPNSTVVHTLGGFTFKDRPDSKFTSYYNRYGQLVAYLQD